MYHLARMGLPLATECRSNNKYKFWHEENMNAWRLQSVAQVKM